MDLGRKMQGDTKGLPKETLTEGRRKGSKEGKESVITNAIISLKSKTTNEVLN